MPVIVFYETISAFRLLTIYQRKQRNNTFSIYFSSSWHKEVKNISFGHLQSEVTVLYILKNFGHNVFKKLQTVLIQ